MTNAVSIAQYGTNNPSWRNRIINGDMRIDQRNNGAAVTGANGYTYAVDRTRSFRDPGATGTFTLQRSTVAPAGFSNSCLLTVTGAQTSWTANALIVPFEQAIEGFNVADFGFGTPNAQPITVSFWIRASVVGLYPVAVFNNDGSAINRSYVTTVALNAANTWEYKTVTIPGDTSGTWQTGSGIGMYLTIGAAGGSNFVASTPNVWNAALREFTANTVNIFATAGATLQITGVQLEAGSVATPFERRPYGTELALCQRYFQAVTPRGNSGGAQSTTTGFFFVPLQTTMRVDPTVTVSGTIIVDDLYATTVLSTTLSGVSSNPQSLQVLLSNFSPAVGAPPRPMQIPAANTGKFLCSAEL